MSQIVIQTSNTDKWCTDTNKFQR